MSRGSTRRAPALSGWERRLLPLAQDDEVTHLICEDESRAPKGRVAVYTREQQQAVRG